MRTTVFTPPDEVSRLSADTTGPVMGGFPGAPSGRVPGSRSSPDIASLAPRSPTAPVRRWGGMTRSKSQTSFLKKSLSEYGLRKAGLEEQLARSTSGVGAYFE